MGPRPAVPVLGLAGSAVTQCRQHSLPPAPTAPCCAADTRHSLRMFPTCWVIEILLQPFRCTVTCWVPLLHVCQVFCDACASCLSVRPWSVPCYANTQKPQQLIPQQPIWFWCMQGRSQGPFPLSKVLQWSAFHPIKEVLTPGNPLPVKGFLLTTLQLCALLFCRVLLQQVQGSALRQFVAQLRFVNTTGAAIGALHSTALTRGYPCTSFQLSAAVSALLWRGRCLGGLCNAPLPLLVAG